MNTKAADQPKKPQINARIPSANTKTGPPAGGPVQYHIEMFTSDGISSLSADFFHEGYNKYQSDQRKGIHFAHAHHINIITLESVFQQLNFTGERRLYLPQHRIHYK
ncbi:hypothetical protein V4V35_18990 [Bacillus infantis]|uniref:hypothetical protein n=1 Tax=Bacillus infantis TaxID=324767 RepID=UPI002FBF1EF6